jgi:DNA polymerase-1
MAKKFVLIDAHSIIFRSYYAFIKHPLKTSKGESTSGIFGFLNTLEKIKKRFRSDYICLAFDAPGETFRDKAYEEYKATRPAVPADIPFQIARVKELSTYLGLPQFECEGYEADDVLATLALTLKDKGEVYIVTSDKDLLQLVGGPIYIYDAYRDEIFDRNKVIEKFGVSPEKIPDYLALIGDTIDNVPGVPGIGPKRAVEIIEKYKDFEEALTKDERLKQHKDSARLSHTLIMLATDVPLDVVMKDLLVKEPDVDKLTPMLIDLEFHSYIKEFSKKHRAEFTLKELKDIADIESKKIIGIDSDDQHVYLCGSEKIVYTAKPAVLKNVFCNSSIIKVGYRLKNLVKHIEMSSPIFDCEIVAWLLDPNRRTYGFEDICLQNLHIYTEVSPASVANLSLRLYPMLKSRLDDCSVLDLYYKIEEPLILVLAAMEMRGIKIDIPYLQDLGRDVERETHQVEKKIYELVDRQFNINSPKQLAAILFEELKLKPVKRGKTHYSTDVDVLQQLSVVHPVPQKILAYRELAKIKSTYIDPLISLAVNSRVHTTFNQAGTATGRLSSSNPNIQNIPIRSELGRKIRKGFIAENGFSLISADYSQVELRILAHITGDKNLIEAFTKGDDIHRHTASLIFGVAEKDVDDKQRRMAKVVNYGLIYGMSDYGLAQSLDIPQTQATEFIESYYNLYPEVAAWRTQAVARAEDRGYTETMFGRKRPLPEIHSRNRTLREFSKRAAINTPIQGTAADLIKLAMVDVEKKLHAAGFTSGLLLSIHDELLFEIEDKRIDEARDIIKESMETVIKLNVPLQVSIGIGNNWNETH